MRVNHTFSIFAGGRDDQQMSQFVNRIARFALGAVALMALGACDAITPSSNSPGVALIRQTVSSGKPTIVEFGAKGCSSCREMKIVLDQVAQRTKGRANILLIDISEDLVAPEVFGIRMIPTQVFFGVDGNETGRHIGILSEAEVLAGLGLEKPAL